jgi:hypothetical protein
MGKKQKNYLEKYTLIKEIGEGGNAKVFHCKTINGERNEVALKDLIKIMLIMVWMLLS